MNGQTEALPFITISREAGAGGHSLAEAILERLSKESDPVMKGWRLCDQEICARLLNNPKLKVSMRALITEEYHGQVEDYLNQLLTRATPQFTVYRKLFKTIRMFALCGKAVIVGRAAACYTRDIPGGVHIRLAAPPADRIVRLQRRFEVNAAKAERMMQTQDAERRRMVKDFFGREVDDELLYDAVLNTGTLEIPVAASLVLEIVKAKMRAIESRRKYDSVSS